MSLRKAATLIACFVTVGLLVGISGLVFATDSEVPEWRTDEFHDDILENEKHVGDGPTIYQVRTRSGEDLVILESTNLIAREHNEEIWNRIHRGEWNSLDEFGDLSETAKEVVAEGRVDQLIEQEFPE